MPVLNLCMSRLSGMPTFHRSFIYIAFELHYLLNYLTSLFICFFAPNSGEVRSCDLMPHLIYGNNQ